ncbi:hypothetical protein O181_133280 [Austropuccinia psidii MF-1]|uniref:Uncharacterized protein n=1 Tax=Austropuccinia psidii MF-1 TaxID=1389203 RepID=A0A9Q3L4G3_9BASI|nr:hypothetical protein [Austropuccinia psidii MF-1]
MLPTLLTILTLMKCPPDMLPTLLTILTLMKCPPDTAYDPYAHGVPSRHTPDTAYDPYARGVPSRHAPDTAYDPYARLVSTLPTCLRHCLRSLRSPSKYPPDMPPTPLTILTFPYYIHSVRWLVGVHNGRHHQNMLSGLLCQQDLRGNWSVYSQCCG